MTGKEAQEILDDLRNIKYWLIEDQEKQAFFHLGVLTERMRHIISVDILSFNPTINKEEMDEL